MRYDAAATTIVDDVRVPVVEEQLVAAKKRVERRVRLHKDTVEVPEVVLVPVQREIVLVERVPVSGDTLAAAGDAFAEFDIDVSLMGEEVIVVDKRARVVEEVRLHKDQVTTTQQVAATMRKERVTVAGRDLEGRAVAGQQGGEVTYDE